MDNPTCRSSNKNTLLLGWPKHKILDGSDRVACYSHSEHFAKSILCKCLLRPFFLRIAMNIEQSSPFLLQLLILIRAVRVEMIIRVLLGFETIFSLIMSSGNAMKLPIFGCWAFPSPIMDFLDKITGTEKVWCLVSSGMVNMGNCGVQIFTMLCSISR